LAGFVEADEGGVGEFADGGVFAGFFSHLFFSSGDVEDVIDDLEGEADGGAVGVDGFDDGVVGGRAEGAHSAGGADEGSGFHAVDTLEVFEGGLGGGGFGFFGVAGIEDLSADHAFDAGGVGEFFDEFDGEFGFGDAGGEEFKGEGVEAVAGEDGEAFAVDFVVGGATAPEVVVVHGGEVIMDEGEAVDHFEGGGGGHGDAEGAVLAAGGLVAEEDEGGSDAFAGAEEGIGHGVVEFWGAVLEAGEVPFEVGVDAIGGVFKKILQIVTNWHGAS